MVSGMGAADDHASWADASQATQTGADAQAYLGVQTSLHGDTSSDSTDYNNQDY